MPNWNPGPEPFPDPVANGPVKDITDVTYLDELHFVRHAKAPPNTSDSLWQLSKKFAASMRVHMDDGTVHDITVTAPRGLYTDLSSVPEIFWNIVGPIGDHLEASILHDYLYMAWTDFRFTARRADWDFADLMMRRAMRASGVTHAKCELIYAAVHSPIGWRVFRRKPYTLRDRMNVWLNDLDSGHGRGSH